MVDIKNFFILYNLHFPYAIKDLILIVEDLSFLLFENLLTFRSIINFCVHTKLENLFFL